MAETYGVIITEPAVQDLEEILEYIADKYSVQSANSVQSAIMEAIYALAEMPDRHGRVKEVVHREDILYRRVIVNKKYRVIYKIEEEARGVYVVRILHVKRGPSFIKKALE